MFESYLMYVKWKFLHLVFSYALQVLATQFLNIMALHNLGEVGLRTKFRVSVEIF